MEAPSLEVIRLDRTEYNAGILLGQIIIQREAWASVRNQTEKRQECQITRALGDFAANPNYEDLSPEVVDWAKYLCLEFAGVTLNGSTTDSAKSCIAPTNN